MGPSLSGTVPLSAGLGACVAEHESVVAGVDRQPDGRPQRLGDTDKKDVAQENVDMPQATAMRPTANASSMKIGRRSRRRRCRLRGLHRADGWNRLAPASMAAGRAGG